MNLALDIGNTSIKLGVFNEDKLLKQHILHEDWKLELQNLTNEFPEIRRSILAAVGLVPDGLLNYLEHNFDFVYLSATTPLPVQLKYHTPETLGADRIALSVGGWYEVGNADVLVIDMGTSITYDFINERGEYLGGAISPGLRMRFKALHVMTSSLPELNPEQHISSYIGKSTKESILSGVQFGISNEIEGTIERYKKDFPNLKVIVSGGDKIFFEEQLKNVIFADANLVLTGLNKILHFNELH